MSQASECDFIDDEPGHFACMLPAGHSGNHRGSNLTCGPLMCDHVIPILVADQRQWLLGRLEELELTEAVSDLTPATRPSRSAAEYRHEIDLIRDEGMFHEALAVSYFVQRLYPDDAHLARQYAELMTGGGLFTDALDVWDALIRSDPLDEMEARDLAGKARCYNGRNQPDRALECADRALLLSPSGFAVPLARLERSDALYRLGRTDEALAELDTCDDGLAEADDDIDPRDIRRRSRFTRCECLIELARRASRKRESADRVRGAWERALAEADDWLRQDPRAPLVHRPRAEILRRLERYEECLGALDAYEATRRRDEHTAYWRADALINLDRPEEALAISEAWLARQPDAKLVLSSHVEALVDLGDHSGGLAALRRYESRFGRDDWSAYVQFQLDAMLDVGRTT